MEAAVVSAATGVMTPLLSKLADLLINGEYAKHKDMRKNIRFLHEELTEMNKTLEMLTDEEHLNPQMKGWRDNLRDMAYDIEDCVDAFIARADQGGRGPKGFKGLVRKMKSLKVRHKIGNEIEELKRRVIEVSDRHKRYNFVPTGNKSSSSCIDPRLSALYVDIEKLVAIDGPKKDIIDLLDIEKKNSSTKVEVVSIYGCGGLGKTTLAKQVYESIKGQFSCTAFVSISQNPDMTKILRDIAEGLEFSGYKLDDDVKQLIDKLRGNLHNKRYLVVIDDIWDATHWEIIGLALLNNNCGSRIITTTRNVKVAESSSQSGSVYEMKPLSPADSKMLLFKRIFGSEKPHCPHLENVPDMILGKCGGLPLAIITISSMLTDKHAKSEWDMILNAIGSALAKTKNPDAEKITSILSLSYNAIPSHLRTCLLYLSLFPEDYVIQKQCLINRWIAEGFIQKEQDTCAYETGESYFNELINRCMIQPVNVEFDQAEACRVHDIILDYIRCKSEEENFVTSLDAKKNVYTSEYKVRRLCVLNYDDGENGTICPDLTLFDARSLTIFGRPVWASLDSFMVLRVLHCDGIENRHIEGIEKLIHLKYLCLNSGLVSKLPEKIGELQYLQTLDVKDTKIQELPLTIRNLQQLARLYVDCNLRFPEGMIGQMGSLEELSQYGVGSYEEGMSLQDFSKLTKLRTLKIKWMFELPDGLEGTRQSEDIQCSVAVLLRNLHNLSVMGWSGSLFPLPLDSSYSAAPFSLRKLCLEDSGIYKVPNWMGSLGNLQILELLIIWVRPEDVEILGAIPCLLYLKLNTFGGIKNKIDFRSSNGYRCLKYFDLHIGACGSSLEFEAGSMPKLEHLKLWFHVHKMKCLNGVSNFGIQHLSALKKVEVTRGGNSPGVYGYDPSDDTYEGIVVSAIKAAVETLPKRPTLLLIPKFYASCDYYDFSMRNDNNQYGWFATKWLYDIIY
ncbi:hypothetical protein ACP4OV_029347 [Aristida adscensionis]